MNAMELTMLDNQLSHSAVKVEFTKVDGTNRVMICTKNPDIITEQYMPSGKSNQVNSSVLKVFDIEKQSWRSMRKSSIIKYEVIDA